jgi:hypothetical protein
MRFSLASGVVIPRDHDGADAHAAQLAETLLDSPLDDVFQLHDSQDAAAIAHHQRSTALAGDLLDGLSHLRRKCKSLRLDVLAHRLSRTLADLSSTEIDAAHSRLRRKRHEGRVKLP